MKHLIVGSLRRKKLGKIKCTAFRLVDSKECPARAKYEVKFDGKHIGFVCGIHKRAYLPKALFPITTGLGYCLNQIGERK